MSGFITSGLVKHSVITGLRDVNRIILRLVEIAIILDLGDVILIMVNL